MGGSHWKTCDRITGNYRTLNKEKLPLVTKYCHNDEVKEDEKNRERSPHGEVCRVLVGSEGKRPRGSPKSG
jgi:hypothetical protein